jgi:hypothetical protein
MEKHTYQDEAVLEDLAIPKTELQILQILETLGGQGTATAIRVASGNTIAQAAIHVFAMRLVKRLLVQRFEDQRDFHGEIVKRISYRLVETNVSNKTKGAKNMAGTGVVERTGRGASRLGTRLNVVVSGYG